MRWAQTAESRHDASTLDTGACPAGQKFKVVLLGGSITLGSGGVDAPPYALRLESWLKAHFPNAEVHMGAVGGTQSSYMALCIRVSA
jgi:hypothetical protein